MVAVRLAALVSDESTLEALYARCAIQIDDLHLLRLQLKNQQLKLGCITYMRLTCYAVVDGDNGLVPELCKRPCNHCN